MTGNDITNLVEGKRRRRNIEYVGLIALQGFFVGSFADSLRIVPAIGAILTTGGLAWTLTQYREKRRVLPEGSKYRIIADVLETLILLLFLGIVSLSAHSLEIPVLLYQAHLSLILMTYFTATLSSETVWVRRIFPALNAAQQLNYIVNLNTSLIFPYNLAKIKRAIQWYRKNDKNL